MRLPYSGPPTSCGLSDSYQTVTQICYHNRWMVLERDSREQFPFLWCIQEIFVFTVSTFFNYIYVIRIKDILRSSMFIWFLSENTSRLFEKLPYYILLLFLLSIAAHKINSEWLKRYLVHLRLNKRLNNSAVDSRSAAVNPGTYKFNSTSTLFLSELSNLWIYFTMRIFSVSRWYLQLFS